MDKLQVQQRVLQNGKPLDLDKFQWDEQAQSFSTVESNLVVDFSGISGCTFKTGSGCTFKTGSDCTFQTGWYCTFQTGSDCTFKTGSGCTFKTGSDCTFQTGWYCTFQTGWYCTFDTESGCTFQTGSDCTFDTESDCTFKTGSGCTFDTGSGCTFQTESDCTFKTGSGCTFQTESDCTFKTGSDCTFKTGWRCTFDTESDCTFKTGWRCTFDTESDCTFKTGWGCTFNTESDCTFKTGWGCTFKTGWDCVLVRRDAFSVVQSKPNQVIQFAPDNVPGYLADGIYSETGKESIIADNILSEIVNKKGNVYRVKNYGATEISYLVTDGENWSHGATLKEAKSGLIYKISSRDTSAFRGWSLDTKAPTVDLIKAYRAITGACASETKAFCERQQLPKQMTVAKAIELTANQYGSETFKKFFSA